MATLQKRIEELEVNFQPCSQHQVSSQPQTHPSPPPPPREVPQSHANHPASPPASNKQPQQQQSQPPPSQDDLKSQMQLSSNTQPPPPPRRHRRRSNYVSPSSPLMSLDNKPRNKEDPRSSHTSNPRKQQAQGPGEFIPSLASPLARGLATVYLKRTLPHAQIDTQKWCTPDQEVTAVRTLMDNHKLILVSAYARPTAEDPNLSWLEELRTAYPDDSMVIGGDFNAHHREWGNDDDDQRGARLLEAYEKAGLELVNDTHEKTRVGTSANQQDTNPDLTLVDSRIEGMERSVFPDAWGSDHYPIEISIRIKNRAKAKKTVVTVLWDKLLRAHIDENDMSTTICAFLVASTKEASTKKEGRAILRLLRQDVSTLPKLGRPIPPWEIADVASSTPVPRNMGLDQPERRRDYAQKHLTVVTTKLEDPTAIALYTDAAHKDLVTTTAWHDLRQNKSWSRETNTAGTPEEAEAQAILHALEHVTQSLNPPVKTVDIYTDAQEAIRRCRKQDPNRPTTRRILALARRLESKNVKATVHWVPGHAGIPGTEAAHPSAEALATFLLSQPQGVDSLPGTSANSGKTGPRKQDETRDRTPYDPEDAMTKVKQDLKKRLLASLPPEPDAIPLGRYSRKKMVLLRRIRTGSAVTPPRPTQVGTECWQDRQKQTASVGSQSAVLPATAAADATPTFTGTARDLSLLQRNPECKPAPPRVGVRSLHRRKKEGA
ncbi:hypothetical protein HPB47_025920 [Ixodes persulcatus]|uniref:Uncharacterized protein n=1 Tax=Ixodes persulcatus TaxID=34615 RepID=A0AC60Q060_IXOPE|nr:hypothetical protein HPB47_025920 [Ixodes persulcatus]